MKIGNIFEIDIRELSAKQKKEYVYFPFMEEMEYNTEYFNTCRTAIEALLYQIKKNSYCRLWLPSYICVSVIDTARRACIDLSLYSVEKDMTISLGVTRKIDFTANDILYIVQHSGVAYPIDFMDALSEVKGKGVMILEDIMLALLSKDPSFALGSYIVGGIREWLALPDGTLIINRHGTPDLSRANSASEYTLNYVISQFIEKEYLKNPFLDKQMFLEYSQVSMKSLFSDYTIRFISDISIKLLFNLDIVEIAKKRIESYDYLSYLISQIPQIRMPIKRVGEMFPLGIVIEVEDKDVLFRYMIRNNIYCNIHWHPSESFKLFSGAEYLSVRLITIPCDQRYGKIHMDYIYRMLKELYEEEYCVPKSS